MKPETLQKGGQTKAASGRPGLRNGAKLGVSGKGGLARPEGEGPGSAPRAFRSLTPASLRDPGPTGTLGLTPQQKREGVKEGVDPTPNGQDTGSHVMRAAPQGWWGCCIEWAASKCDVETSWGRQGFHFRCWAPLGHSLSLSEPGVQFALRDHACSMAELHK